jgi:hypothetical protein
MRNNDKGKSEPKSMPVTESTGPVGLLGGPLWRPTGLSKQWLGPARPADM